MAFAATGLIGLVWVLFWWPLYRKPAEHPRLGAEERKHIESDPPEPAIRVSWLELLRHRQAWAFAVGKFLTDSVWWFYLFWFPLFMADTFGFDLRNIGLPMVTVYLLADVGSVGGGWLSSNLLKHGLDAERRAQDRDAGVRDPDPAGGDGAPRRESVDRGVARGTGGGGAPGLLRQHLHDRVRHVPEARRSDPWSASAVSPARWEAS